MIEIPVLNFNEFYYQVFLYLIGVFRDFFAGSVDFPVYLFWFKVIAGVLSVMFFIGIVLNISGLVRLRKKQLNELVKTFLTDVPEERNLRWEKIKKYLDSNNPSDWKIAILEADNLIDDILKQAGFKGDTLGERLLKVKPQMLVSLPDLFRAHLVRNRVIHEGTTFELTKEKTLEVTDSYEKSLKELGYI